MNISRIIRYIVSGTTAAAVDLGCLYVLTDIAGVWYLYSIAIAFVIAVVVSFLLQKFWTFTDRDIDGIGKQATTFFVLQVINSIVNEVVVAFLVEHVHVWYLAAQFFMLVIISVWSFFLYRFIVFARTTF